MRLCPSRRTHCAGARARPLANSSPWVGEFREILDADTRAPDRHAVSRATSRPTVAKRTPCSCAGRLTAPQRRHLACVAAWLREASRLIRAIPASMSPGCTVFAAKHRLPRSAHGLAGPRHRSSGATWRLIGAKWTPVEEEWTPILMTKRGATPSGVTLRSASRQRSASLAKWRMVRRRGPSHGSRSS
jgi:hypothetical protein